MKTLLGVLVVSCAMGLAACGDKGSDAVGTWTLDAKASIDATREALKAHMPPGAPAQALNDAANMADRTFGSMTADLTLKGDKTYTGKVGSEGRSQVTSGTWSASGDQVTFTPLVKDGEPLTGEAAKPVTMTLKGNTLSGSPNPEMAIVFVLKRG